MCVCTHVLAYPLKFSPLPDLGYLGPLAPCPPQSLELREGLSPVHVPPVDRAHWKEPLCSHLQVSFGRDFEQQLSFYVEARSMFCNLEPVLVQLIHVSWVVTACTCLNVCPACANLVLDPC